MAFFQKPYTNSNTLRIPVHDHMIMKFNLLVTNDDIIDIIIERFSIRHDEAIGEQWRDLWELMHTLYDEQGTFKLQTFPLVCGLLELIKTRVRGGTQYTAHGCVVALQYRQAYLGGKCLLFGRVERKSGGHGGDRNVADGKRVMG